MIDIDRKERKLAEFIERRASIISALESMITTAQIENRALDDFETELFDELEAEAKALRRDIPRLRDSLSADRQHAENTRDTGITSPNPYGNF